MDRLTRFPRSFRTCVSSNSGADLLRKLAIAFLRLTAFVGVCVPLHAIAQIPVCTAAQQQQATTSCNAEAQSNINAVIFCLANFPSAECGSYPDYGTLFQDVTGLGCHVQLIDAPVDLGTPRDGSFDSEIHLVDCDPSPNNPDPNKNRGGCNPVNDCGDPINSGTGNKYQTEVDYSGSGVYPLRMVRTYNFNGGAANANRFGNNWLGSYSESITLVTNGGTGAGLSSAASLQRSDGTRYTFRQTGAGAPWIATGADVVGTLTQLLDGSGNVLGWTFTNPRNEVETYNAAGKLQSIANRLGLAQTLTYNTAGFLAAVADPTGRQLTFTYDGVPRVITMTDPAGGVYTYAYGSSLSTANLSSVTYPDGRVRSYLYAESALVSSTPVTGLSYAHALTGLVDENGSRYASWAYDSQGRSTSSDNAGSQRVTLSYSGGTATSSTTVTDALNTIRTINFQTVLGVVRKTSQTQPAGTGSGSATISMTFDANGNVASRTDWNGNVTVYGYDLTRNLETSRTEAFGSPQARTISTQWDANFRLPMRVAEALRITSYAYNGEGASCGVGSDGATPVPGVPCTKTIQPTSDATGSSGFGASATGAPRTWSYSYNANGSVLTMDGPRTDVSDVTRYSYYANNDADPGKRGNVASITNALGQTTQILSYNAHGQPLTVVDPNGLTTNLTYDLRQRLTSRNVGGEITNYGYDAVGQLLRVTLPDGSFLSYSYDAAHRLTAISDSSGASIAYTLDAMGNRIQEQVFDQNGSLAQTRSRVYNALSRLAQDIGAQSQTTQYAYDNQGNVTGVTDPLGHASASAYDALNRLVAVTDPGNGITRYAYSGINQLIAVTDPRNLSTSYAYDGLSNLNAQASPDTGTTQNTYDSAGNLLTQVDAKNQLTTYTYDALNRVTGVRFADGSSQSYGYDQGANGLGRLTFFAETNPSAQITIVHDYAYDSHGRAVTENRTINGVNYAFGYSYDAAGRLAGLTYPSGRTIAYGFDAVGRINQVSTTASPNSGGATQAVASNVLYQPFGGVKSYLLGNGQTYSRSYDQDGRIAAYGAGSLGFSLGYDPAGRIISIANTASSGNPNTYGYDSLDRLTSAITPALTYGYTYDGVGDRTSKTAGTATDTYTYAATSNRLASISGSSGRSFAFDANGSTLGDGNNSYSYDARGRMASATSATGTAFYQVNALGQRVRKTTVADDRVFLYDLRGHLIAESSPTGAVLREYVYLNDIPLAVIQ